MPEIKHLDPEGVWDHSEAEEYLYWPRVLWIDPGVVSGVAVVWFDPKALFEGAPTPKTLLAYSEIFLDGPESGTDGQVHRFLKLRRVLDQESGLATGIESFIPRQLNMDQAFLAPVRLRAAIEFTMSRTVPREADEVGPGVPLHSQSPSDALGSFNNQRLRDLQMFRPGPDHVNDAKRHCLLWIRKLKLRGMDYFKQAHGFETGWFE